MKTLTLLAVALAALPGFASGQNLIVQTKTFNGTPEFQRSLLFEKFDGPLSALSSVSLTYTFTMSGAKIIMDNDGEGEAVVAATVEGTLDAQSTEVRLLDASDRLIIQNVTLEASDLFSLAGNEGDGLGDYDPSGPDGAIFEPGTMTKSGGTDVNTKYYSDFVGNDDFTVDLFSNQSLRLNHLGGVESITTPAVVSGTVTLAYCVPEPSSAALLGLAAVGLAFRRRRA